MDFVKSSIDRPVAVIAFIVLAVVFGLLGLFRMPTQLSPTVTEPEITVQTIWPGATPYEIERDIIEEQEKYLKGLPGLEKMESSAFNNMGRITLRFSIGTEVDEALLRVSNKMNEVPDYPENVDKPSINATGGEASPVIWMILKTLPGNDRSVKTYKTYFENDVRQHIERVPGVADFMGGGGVDTELHVTLDRARLIAHGLTVNDVFQVLSSENVNISAGTMGVDRRNYRIRTVAEFKTPEDVENVVISSTGQSHVYLRDVASVALGYAEREWAMMHNGEEGIATGVKPEHGTNILEMTDRLEEVVNWLNEEKLKERGLYLDWVYDQRPYIKGAINLVIKNIFIGGVLAVVILLLFLRSVSSTIIVATAIPISAVGTFIIMYLLGRNINVVSLAGISFAVGMLVDNAIVVLENIDRHRRMDKSPYDAAYDGTKEVWGAILTSTVTTVAVFLPVVFIEQEAGQLFRDIAIAITCSVTLSLFVSISVIPMLSNKLFSMSSGKRASFDAHAVRIGGELSNGFMALVRLATDTVVSRFVTVISLTAFAVLSAYLLLPKMEYLPQGNRNLVINFLIPPPGLSYEERRDIGEHIFDTTKPYMGKDFEGYPAIKNMFYVGSENFMIFGAIAAKEHEQRAGELIPLFTKTIVTIPGMFGVSSQASIFQTGLGRGRTIDVDISGGDINSIVAAAGMMFGVTMQTIEGAQIRPIPSLELLYPEVRFVPNRERVRAAGMTSLELGLTLDVMMGGRKIGEFKEEGKKKVDMILKAEDKGLSTPEELYASSIVTPSGRVVPISSLASIERAYGITEIRHLERVRTVTLQVTPPKSLALEEAMEIIEGTVIPAVRDKGMLDGMEVTLSGAADKLTETRQVLQWNFLLALLITYLLMSALFGNFIYPLIIMFTVPLAAAGGFMGLKLVDTFIKSQALDILTMLGFVILIGVVVNNAILIIHQALNNIHLHGMAHREAVLESTRSRLRPIYMSACTSIFGMMPLVVFPGPGAELYRGLGSVVLGGLALSTVFTVFVVPALLMFVIKMEKLKVDE